MAIGVLSRLGVANCVLPNAYSFAQNVLLLPWNAPVYQQQIVHSVEWLHGPGMAAAEWCSTPDNEGFTQNVILRELSAHHTQFARRNIADGIRFAYVWFRSNSWNQIFYVNNEPDSGSFLTTPGDCRTPDCWDPPNRTVDTFFNSAALVGVCWPNPSSEFYENANGFLHLCGSGTPRRVKAQALAYIYLTLKRNAENLGRGHFVLPPALSDAALGASSVPGIGSYNQTFFDTIHRPYGGTVTVPGSAPAQLPISVSELRALHIHHYALIPNGSFTPLESVATSATHIRKGADWYRNTYNNGADIPLDIMLSEMGPDWHIGGPIKWTGLWANYRLGLSWWNSWLRWLMLSASSECRLSGWQTFSRFVYGCVHEASEVPHTTNSAPTYANRNQWFVDCDLWDTYVHYNVPVIAPLDANGIPDIALGEDGRYKRTVSAWDSVQWGRKGGADVYWRRTPFGACYTVWSQAGTQVATGNLNTGWVTNTQAGWIGDADVYLPRAGYNTIYIPAFKDAGAFPANGSINVQWIRPDGTPAPYTVTNIDLAEVQDTTSYSKNGYIQTVYSAMVWPFVCRTNTPKTIKLRLTRGANGPQIYVGKPVALPGMCSWFITQ